MTRKLYYEGSWIEAVTLKGAVMAMIRSRPEEQQEAVANRDYLRMLRGAPAVPYAFAAMPHAYSPANIFVFALSEQERRTRGRS